MSKTGNLRTPLVHVGNWAVMLMAPAGGDKHGVASCGDIAVVASLVGGNCWCFPVRLVSVISWETSPAVMRRMAMVLNSVVSKVRDGFAGGW